MKCIVIAAGGSGGHIIPALAVARALGKHSSHRVCWLGGHRMQDNILNQESFPAYKIILTPWRGGGILRKLTYLCVLPVSLVQTLVLFLRIKADAVFSTGGYASFPAAIIAGLLGMPVFLQEQNARWSLAGKILKSFSRKIYTAYPQISEKDSQKIQRKVRLLGNPILEEKEKDIHVKQRYMHRKGPMRLFITGGSQGALVLNDIMPKNLQNQGNWVVRHQCGRGWLKRTQENYKELVRNKNLDLDIQEFYTNMSDNYAWADLIVARAGAMTIQEIIETGVAAILVPYPYATDNHQWFNAHHMLQKKAAFLVEQPDASKEINKIFSSLKKESQDDKRKRLAAMANRAYRLRTPYSAKNIALDLIQELESTK